MCVGVPATKQEDAYGVLGAFSLQEGARRSDVIWLEVFESSGPSAGGARSGGGVVQRCETTDASSVVRRRAEMR